MRQVHAVPRGHALDDEILRKLEAGDASELPSSTCCSSVCDRIIGKSPLPARRLRRYPVASYVDKFRDEFVAHLDSGGCPFEGESPLEGILAPSERPRPRRGARVTRRRTCDSSTVDDCHELAQLPRLGRRSASGGGSAARGWGLAAIVESRGLGTQERHDAAVAGRTAPLSAPSSSR